MNTTLRAIAQIIETADKFRSSYFWTPPSGASARRYIEQINSHKTVRWTEGGHEYTAAYSVRVSCWNVYASGTYTKDGRKTTLTAIKNSYKRMTKGE